MAFSDQARGREKEQNQHTPLPPAACLLLGGVFRELPSLKIELVFSAGIVKPMAGVGCGGAPWTRSRKKSIEEGV